MISIEQLKAQLEQQYNLVCFTDLAKVANKHTEIYKLLSSLYRASYDHNDRLVFYSSHKPTLSFLYHLQRAVSKTDISNFFVCICCPDDIASDLTTANKKYGYDDQPIQSLQIDVTPTLSLGSSEYIDWDTMCFNPFVYLDVDSLGDIKPCCFYKKTIGNIRTHSLKEVFQSKDMDDLRHALSTGQRPPECSHCWSVEEKGNKSTRQIILDRYTTNFDHEWGDRNQIRTVMMSLGTVCNFKCRICNSVNSSMYRAEELKFETNPHRIETIHKFIELSDWFESENNVQNKLKEVTEHISNIGFYGGEPFLLKNVKTVLRELIDSGRANQISLYFNTNGSIFPEELVNDIFPHFKQVEILFSIDNVGERFELERGGDWNTVHSNLKRFCSLTSKNLKFVIQAVVSIQNIFYLDDVLKLEDEFGVEVLLNYLTNPHSLNIDHMTNDAKNLVVTKYQDHSDSRLSSLALRIKNSTGSNGKSFVEFVSKFDQRRNENFSSTHPEIFKAMGGLPKDLISTDTRL